MSDGEKVGTHCYECGQEIDGDVYEGRSAEDWFGTAQAEAQIAEERGREIERLKEQKATIATLTAELKEARGGETTWLCERCGAACTTAQEKCAGCGGRLLSPSIATLGEALTEARLERFAYASLRRAPLGCPGCGAVWAFDEARSKARALREELIDARNEAVHARAEVAVALRERDEAQRGLEGWNDLWHRDIRRAFYAEDVAKAAMRAGLEECVRLRTSMDKVRTERQISEEYGCAAREEIERLRGLLEEIVLDRSELWPMYSALRSRVAECLGRSK